MCDSFCSYLNVMSCMDFLEPVLELSVRAEKVCWFTDRCVLKPLVSESVNGELYLCLVLNYFVSLLFHVVFIITYSVVTVLELNLCFSHFIILSKH